MTSTVAISAEQRAQIKEIVCEILEIEPAEVTDTSLFKEDHNADSLGSIEILSSLERTFQIEIDQTELVRMVNLDGVVAVVQEGLSA
ncbi:MULTISPECIES: acyl carrier protein [Streptomyces]|uniref:Acyl carrier protein n=1 Tax=Streptomyces venezuelae (strain ATCC 10712 / CBS 650.69 / DSM 40230 / JCM 4526 / NBRC 13096 / PD 04745) TaxID=953739 RepID=F2RDN0_STRVP|nr:acyl carrier protein [Streptomyces venezuelae]APE24987.1 polyketide-8 synthase acyl carrier protein [Streptomyces venezuelae]QES02332.1 acyl carrier protein [Streptomyces venezuelae ATCC 10712]QES09312.1 acyl carrier protein [Streptomyces venezuelae]QES12025.1 acyl carrier protein [Streptomyces venezuelae]CCA59522.1 acyl carrier protein [Streptomyces venezuelae ATCC 10712]